jgi:hypothetical protein
MTVQQERLGASAPGFCLVWIVQEQWGRLGAHWLNIQVSPGVSGPSPHTNSRAQSPDAVLGILLPQLPKVCTTPVFVFCFSSSNSSISWVLATCQGQFQAFYKHNLTRFSQQQAEMTRNALASILKMEGKAQKSLNFVWGHTLGKG